MVQIYSVKQRNVVYKHCISGKVNQVEAEWFIRSTKDLLQNFTFTPPTLKWQKVAYLHVTMVDL